ncbi:MAG: membrane protein insertion efficiency factor YidD [Gaiellaceae bacterium]
MTALARLVVRGYQRLLSPFLPARCKYHPTCSQYALDAISEYGPARGGVLAAWRLLRCNPWSHGGVDYVRDQTMFGARS